MEQHFTQSNEPIGLMVTTGFMTARDVTRLGTCSKLYHDMIAQNSLTWNNISIKNRTLTEYSLPKTLAARNAVTELSVDTNFVGYVPGYMCEFPRLEVFKITQNGQNTQRLPEALINKQQYYHGFGLAERLQQIINSLPPSVISFHSMIYTWSILNEISLPYNIKSLVEVDLGAYTSDNEITEIIYKPSLYHNRLLPNELNIFTKLQVLVLFNTTISYRTVFPNTLHTVVLYNYNQSSFLWPETLRKNIRICTVISNSTNLINILTFNYDPDVKFPNLENLTIIISFFGLTTFSIQSLVDNILVQKLVFPQLKFLRILYRSNVSLPLPIIKTKSTIGLNIFVGPIPDDLEIDNARQILDLSSLNIFN